MLGDRGFEQLQNFDRARDARDIVEQVARGTNYSATPVTDAQANQLADILARNNSGYRAGRRFTAENLDWNAALQDARSLLGENQLAALADVRDRILFSQTLNRAVGEAMTEAKRAAGVPPKY